MNIWEDSNNSPDEKIVLDNGYYFKRTEFDAHNEFLLAKNRRGGNKVTAKLAEKLYERDNKGSSESPSEG